MKNKAEEVRDGFLGDLPEELRIKVMNIHKVIVDKTRAEFKLPKYNDINQTTWAKGWLEEFLAEPSDNNHIGSVRVYKKGKRYRCMIQISGHVTNNRNTEDEELFHGMIRNVFVSIRSIIRRKYDCTITCESEHGEPFEGLDIWTKQKTAVEVWEKFEGLKTKKITPMKESTGMDVIYTDIFELPSGLQSLIQETACDKIAIDMNKLARENGIFGNVPISEETISKCLFGYTELIMEKDGLFSGSIEIPIGPMMEQLDNDKINELLSNYYESIYEKFEAENPGKYLMLEAAGKDSYFEIVFESMYAEKLYEYLENNREPGNNCGVNRALNESVLYDPYMESEEYNVKMSDKEAKRTLATLTSTIINSNDKVTQYTANIYANIITKNLLQAWAPGYRKLSITLTSDKAANVFEFQLPTIGKDFVARYIEGRESINGLLHRTPEIKIKMSPKMFKTLKNRDDAYNFFRAAIKYYDQGIAKYSEKLCHELMGLDRDLKYLISTTKLSAMVTCPIQMLVTFDEVDMSSKNTFIVSKEEINTINQFIKNIYSRYAAPEKEKKEIVEDLEKIIQSFREAFDDMQFGTLSSAVSSYYEGAFDSKIKAYNEMFYMEQVDEQQMRESSNEVKYYREKFGVKKLKKIPRDLVAYITIETEAIKDANDKYMICSYCLGKLEIVEWYIELLDTGSKRYVVPHTKPYLENLRTQLLACYKKIMEVKIKNPQDKPIIDVKYPAGYEG